MQDRRKNAAANEDEGGRGDGRLVLLTSFILSVFGGVSDVEANRGVASQFPTPRRRCDSLNRRPMSSRLSSASNQSSSCYVTYAQTWQTKSAPIRGARSHFHPRAVITTYHRGSSTARRARPRGWRVRRGRRAAAAAAGRRRVLPAPLSLLGRADGFGFLFGFGPLCARPSLRPRSSSLPRSLVLPSRPLCSSDRTKYKFHLNPKLESGGRQRRLRRCCRGGSGGVWISLLFLLRRRTTRRPHRVRPSFFPL